MSRRLEDLARAIAALRRPLLVALDVDGTLAPIVEDPAQAAVPPATVRALERLHAVDGVTIALVTGRDAAQLGRMIELPGVWRAVEHGAKVVGPGERAVHAVTDEEARRLARFRAWAKAEAAPIGARIEEKAGSIGVHVRELAARDPAEADELLTRARAAAAREGLHPRDGRAVLEAQLAPSDKGSALRELLARTGAASCVYAGDDLTDEPAIRMASTVGIGIFVRSAERTTAPEGAAAVVEGPAELVQLLALLAA